MSNLDQAKLKAMAAELAKSVKTQADLSELSSMLVKMTVEAAQKPLMLYSRKRIFNYVSYTWCVIRLNMWVIKNVKKWQAI